MGRARNTGFSFIELLLSVVLISVISSFTIPKVLHASQQGEYSTLAKDTMAMMSEAYDQHKYQNPSTRYIQSADLVPYFNGVSQLPINTQIDWVQGGGQYTCGNNCYRLATGAVIAMTPGYFCNDPKSTTHVLIDPDGRVTDGTPNGPGKSLMIFLQASGAVKTYANIEPATPTASTANGTCDSSNSPSASADPNWFSWT